MQPRLRNQPISDPAQLVTKRRLQDLINKIEPTERLDPEAEQVLLEIADEFLDSVAHTACRLAKHRKSSTLEVKDVQLHLERNWNIRIPGFASEEIRSVRKSNLPSSHVNKLSAVNQAKANPIGLILPSFMGYDKPNSTPTPAPQANDNNDEDVEEDEGEEGDGEDGTPALGDNDDQNLNDENEDQEDIEEISNDQDNEGGVNNINSTE